MTEGDAHEFSRRRVLRTTVGARADGQDALTVRDSVLSNGVGWGIILRDGTLTGSSNTDRNDTAEGTRRPRG